MPLASIEKIFSAINTAWDTAGVDEITLEANPDDLTGAYLQGVREATPVNRLSIGVQSFDQATLKLMNRRHDAAGAAEAIAAARSAGFDNISADLIYGVPGMTVQAWEDSVEKMLNLTPEHISAYHLTIEPGTPFHRLGMRPVDEEVSRRHYDILCDKLHSAGYIHYEISNFALPGFEARHNSAYWDGRAYLGAGPSAHSYDGGRQRRWSAPSLESYLAGVVYQQETLSDDDLYNEYIMTSLRTARGIDPAQLAARFGQVRLNGFAVAAQPYLDSGAMIKKEGRIAIPPSGFLISDSIISSLFA